MGRLSKGKRDLSSVLAENDLPPLARENNQLHVWQLPSMAEAAAAHHRTATRYFPRHKLHEREFMVGIGKGAIAGDSGRLNAAVAHSEELIADAIVADPRLARRSQWRRSEEGEIACPALLMTGDDAPCFMRVRAVLGQPNGAEPVRVVISTDDGAIPPRTAAAFIATVRLVQQWRPVEIWCWLGGNRATGFVFHVPLVKGDMDFGRLEFCIADPRRDVFSWHVMAAYACETAHVTWNGCSLQAQRSYLPGRAHFVSHKGIDPEGDSIAFHAAMWLDWESHYSVRYDQDDAESAALQRILLPRPDRSAQPATKAEIAEAEARRRRYDEECRRREAAAARQREEAINLTY
jgi:hypothetical protein